MANFFKAVVKPQTSYERLTVCIDKLDNNGVGIARWKNRPLFIAGTLPNEIVEVKIIEQKNKYARAKIIAYKKKSEKRIEPACQHFGLCGGCDLQMLTIDEQLLFKQQKVTELFSRSFSAICEIQQMKQHNLPWQKPIYSHPWHYRRKARIGVQFDKKSQATIGFRQKSTNQLASIKTCPVLVEPINTIFPLLKKVLAQLTVKSAIGHIEVIKADVNDLNATINTNPTQKSTPIVLVIRQTKVMSDADKSLWLRSSKIFCWHIIIDDGNKQFTLTENDEDREVLLSYSIADDINIEFSSSDFIQVNHQVNLDMINQAMTWLNLSETDNVLDLFCGLGNFSLALAKKSNRVIGVEGVQVMVNKAAMNARKNGINNCEFYQADLNSDWLSQSWANDHVFDKVLLDPARAGAEEAVKQIAILNISTVLYVSCDPATLARDSAVLVSSGYKLERISLLDMFSQTKHVETMVLFTR